MKHIDLALTLLVVSGLINSNQVGVANAHQLSVENVTSASLNRVSTASALASASSTKLTAPPGGQTPPAESVGSAQPPKPETSKPPTSNSQTSKLEPPSANSQLFQATSKISKKALVPNHPRQVIKFGNQFLLLDDSGLMPVDNRFGYGLYRDDTRFLSAWDVRINDAPLTLLYKNTEDGFQGRYVYANSDSALPAEKALVERDVLIGDRVYERMRVTNYDTIPRTFAFTVRFSSDFADMFEVRGQDRPKVGMFAGPKIESDRNRVILSYTGLDKRTMNTAVEFSKSGKLSGNEAKFQVNLGPHESWTLQTAVHADYKSGLIGSEAAGVAQGLQAPDYFDREKRDAEQNYSAWRKVAAEIQTDNETFNQWLERSFRDIYILRQPFPKGDGIAAGVPWFAVAFGRDQEITSMETLALMPRLTHDVLGVLCAYQGTKDDPFTQEKPGRIMHELRLGEMARLREIPFIPYYGTVDATPLFLVLMGRYVDTTGDVAFAKEHWENIERALGFLDNETKRDGYLRYGWGKGSALTNIGWKDSGDSVMYSDGKLASQPIALCEVQGYLYEGWNSAAALAERIGKPELAQALRAKATDLRARFNRDFWNDRLGVPALALDGNNRQCDVVSSNAGHVLSSGILSPEQQSSVSEKLMKPDMFSGWGIRTLSSREAAYNPLSYHNGSIWPHDNAMIANGLASASRPDLAAKVLDAMFNVARSEPDLRLPELFCGFPSAYAEKPIWYPVSCSPQAWAAGSVFMMLQSTLGITVDAAKKQVHIKNPHLPTGVSRLTISHMPIGDASADLRFTRSGETVSCALSSESGVTSVIEHSP